MTARRIETGGFRPPSAIEAGPAPSLLWLKTVELVVDETYQRRISHAGRKAIQAIVDDFEWSRFSPVLVAPLEGGIYAIIDGQHRTTAAAVCGFDMVPCQLVQADRRRQAAAFAAVNGRVQRISTMHVYHAAHAAEEGWAVAVGEVAAAAGVTILKYPIMAHSPARPRHSTMSVRAIQRIVDKHDSVFAATVLRSITRSALGDDPATLGDRWISGIASALAERPRWAADEVRLQAFFDELDAGAALKASDSYAKNSIISQAEALAIVLRAEFDIAEPAWAPAPAALKPTAAAEARAA
jgi:hypothetical protein